MYANNNELLTQARENVKKVNNENLNTQSELLKKEVLISTLKEQYIDD
jgi:hypothetical protein